MATPVEYAELHCHSNFSFLDGASHPEDMVARAAALGYFGIAVTDRDGLYAAVRLDVAAKEHNIRPIFGSEVTIDDGSRLTLLATGVEGYHNLSMLLTAGRRARPKGEAAVSWELLSGYTKGLIALSGTFHGRIPAALLRDDDAQAYAAAGQLLDLFGQGRVYLEVTDHMLPIEAKLRGRLVELARRMDLPLVATQDARYAEPGGQRLHDVLTCIRHHTSLREAGTKLMPNGDYYLHDREELSRRFRALPEALRNTRVVAEQCRLTLSQLNFNLPDFPVPPPHPSMLDYLEHLTFLYAPARFPEVNAKVVRQLRHELEVIGRHRLEGYFLIVWDIMKFCHDRGILAQGRGSAANSAVCFALGITNVDPIQHGLLFERFLSEGRNEAPDIDMDIANDRREEVIQYVYERYGRDHAGMVCEVICYRARSAVREVGKALGLSLEQVDRLAKNLERRWPSKAAEPPPEGQEVSPEAAPQATATKEEEDAAVVAEVTWVEELEPDPPPAAGVERSDERASEPRELQDEDPLTAPPVALEKESARKRATHLRLVSKTDAPLEPASEEAAPEPPTGMPPALPKTAPVPAAPVPTPPASVPLEPAPAASPAAPPDEPPPITAEEAKTADLLFELCQQIEGFPRHLGIHVGGMIICATPLGALVPIENAAMEGRTVIQWDKDDIGALKMPKIDLLGLGMLSLIAEAIELVEVHERIRIDPARLTYDDPATYQMMCVADTVGVFQVESRAQMSVLPRLKPRKFYDLVVQVSLIRPGPIQGEMVHPYLRRRAGEEPIEYPHPDLEPILARTLGVPLFQEQGMKVAVTAAGFTASEADALRRAMSSKRSRGQMEALTRKLLDGMQNNGYSEEIATRIVNQIKAFASYGFPESHAASFGLLVYVSAFLKRHHPLAFYAALLNNQPMGFYAPATIVRDAQRHGLPVLPVDVVRSSWDWTIEGDALRAGLRSVKGLGGSHREQWEAARTRGPWKSVGDFCERVGWSKLHLERMAAIGAFGGLGVDRREALWQVQGYRERPGLAAPQADELEPELKPVSPAEALVMDLSNAGHSVGPHPIQLMRGTLDRWKVVPSHQLDRIRGGQLVRVAGVVSIRQRPPTAKGFCFLTLEDEGGMMNIVVRPDKYEEYRPAVRRSMIVLVEGFLQRQKGVVNIQAEKVAALDDRFAAGLRSRDFH